MTSYHIIIQQERRTPVVRSYKDYIGRREQRTEIDPEDGEQYTTSVMIDADDPSAWETYTQEDRSRLAQSIADQLHTHSAASLPENISDPQFVMVAEWDGTSPYVVIHKGDYSQRTMGYAGWPELTMEEYEAQKEKGDAPLGTPPL